MHFENLGKVWSLLSPDKYADKVCTLTLTPYTHSHMRGHTDTFHVTVGGSQTPLSPPGKEAVTHSDFFIVQVTRALREAEGLGLDHTAHS